MRILVNTDTFEPLGGVERSTLQVSGDLARRGHDLRLLHAAGPIPPTEQCGTQAGLRAGDRPGDRGQELRSDWAGIVGSMDRAPGFTVAARRPWRTVHQLPASVRAAARIAPDAIYLNRSEQLPWALASRRVTDAGLVVHLRHHPFASPLVRFFCSRPLGAPRVRYVAVSDFLRDRWIAAGLNPDVVWAVPNGVDPQVYRPPTATERRSARAAVGITDERPVVLSYGRLSPEKGVDVLLDAWDRLPDQADPTHRARPTLLLAGDPTPDVAARIAARRDGDVRQLPRRAEVLGLLHAADLVVLPAVWPEPFGRVVIEAMAAGVPVIASRVGGLPEILTGRFADQLVPANDPAALAAAIAGRLDWRRRTPGLGPAGRAHVQRSFTLSGTVDVVESLLSEVATRSSATSTVRPAPTEPRVAA